jgi:uncharacterized protein YoxC
MADKWLPILGAAFTRIVDGFLGNKGKGPAYNIGVAFKNMATAIGDVLGIIVGKNKGDGQMKTFAETLQSVADSIQAITDAINFLKPAFKILLDINKHMPNLITLVNAVKGIGNFGAQFAEGLRQLGSNIGGGLTGLSGGFTGMRALGGPVTRGKSYLVGEHGPELFTPMGGGSITPNGRLNGGGHTFILNGIIDAESARRAIERVLQQSSIRTGAVNIQGSLI